MPGIGENHRSVAKRRLADVGTSFIVPVEFNQFDPTLGVLTEITLSLKASFSGTVGVEKI